MNYAFTVSTTGCYAWNETVKQWDYACRVSTDKTLLYNFLVAFSKIIYLGSSWKNPDQEHYMLL